MNCKDCKHWKKQESAGWQPLTFAQGGWCQSDNITEYYGEYRPDTLVYSYNEGGDFWTGPLFGCVHFEKATG